MPTPRVTSQTNDLAPCTLETACWLWLECCSKNVANSHPCPGPLNNRLRSSLVPQCSHPLHHQGRIQPVIKGGNSRNISQLGFDTGSYCKRDEVGCASQHCCDKTVDGKMTLCRECYFPKCTKSRWVKLLLQVSGRAITPIPPWIRPLLIINDALRIVTECLRPTQADCFSMIAGIQPAELRRPGATLLLTRRAMAPGYLLCSALTCPPCRNARHLKSTPICTRRTTTCQFNWQQQKQKCSSLDGSSI